MSPFTTYSELIFTCVDGPLEIVAKSVLDFRRTYMSNSNVPGATIEYPSRETPLDFSLAYIDVPARVESIRYRTLFWEPRNRPNATVIMCGNFSGMGGAVGKICAGGPYTWINLRMYRETEDCDPGCFFHYYAAFRRFERFVEACKCEAGWYFGERGPVQDFENTSNYTRELKRERLTIDIVIGYLKCLGFQIADDNFWNTDRPAIYSWQEYNHAS